VGTRNDMVVYDCDDEEALATLERRVIEEDLLSANLLASFAPDTLAEARNRGFRPHPSFLGSPAAVEGGPLPEGPGPP
jgi:hypothetical protein